MITNIFATQPTKDFIGAPARDEQHGAVPRRRCPGVAAVA
jgi:hypothetical protein